MEQVLGVWFKVGPTSSLKTQCIDIVFMKMRVLVGKDLTLTVSNPRCHGNAQERSLSAADYLASKTGSGCQGFQSLDHGP
jgi:hypothetical protein